MIHAVVGLQFGDEGKGKFVDYLSQTISDVARFNGGANAGHTVCYGGKTHSFSQLPASPDADSLYVCPGALITPSILLREIEFYEGRSCSPDIAIDPRCHIVLPIHVALNKASEAFKGKDKIGSVGQGIGACMEDRTNRVGLRLCDLQDEPKLRKRLELLWRIRKSQIEGTFSANFNLDFEQQVHELVEFGHKIRPYLQFTNKLLLEKLSNGHPVLLETSQATFLDNIYGTYPYGVSYQSLVQSCFPLMGIPPSKSYILGVMKAYMIRVGNGPFPTEISGTVADNIRREGNEYGTVSGRPRRCGWVDLNLVRQAVRLNGVTEIALTNVDVLAGHDRVPVCIGYQRDGLSISTDAALLNFDSVEPQMFEMPGWPKIDTVGCFEELHENLQAYIELIETFVGAPVRYISYGPDRDQTLDRKASKPSKSHLADNSIVPLQIANASV